MVYGECWFWQPCGELLHSVRTGQSAFEYVHNQALFAYLDQDGAAAASFNTHQTNMTCLDVGAILNAYDFAQFTTMVDVGGGHGALAAAIAQACPQLLIARGRERTAAEYQALLEQAGFMLRQIVPTRSPASIIEAVPTA